MAATVEIIIKTLDQSTKEMSKIDKGLKTLKTSLKDLAKVWAATAVAAAVTFKAFERGAVVKQTAQSFDLLLKKVGAAPGLLNQLDQAANGTISRMEIMSSTSILLAGAQGELASNLAKSTPRLLEIAKAANKLNPSLGTTAFLYESLGRGIKRTSPLILDNLGLTIKIGEANKRYADSLGKSVDELTAAERQQALLNETLRAGDILINQVGGDIDSLTDSTAKATAGFKNLKDAILADVTGGGTFFGQLGDDMSDIALLIDEFGTGRVAGALASPITQGFDPSEHKETREELINEFNRRKALESALSRGIGARSTADQFGPDFDDQSTTLQDAAAVAKMKATIDGIGRVTPIRVLSDLDVGIASRIADELNKIDFEQAGGAAVQKEFELAQRRFEAGKLTLQQYEQILQNISVKAAAVAVAMGDMTISDAARQVADELGISFAEALALLQGINTQLGNINGTVVKATVRIDVTGEGAGFVISGGLGGGAGVRSGASGKVLEARAAGGPTVAGRSYVVGEDRPEIFTPRTSGSISSDAAGGNSEAVEAGLANLSKEFKNGLLDLGQTIVAAVG